MCRKASYEEGGLLLDTLRTVRGIDAISLTSSSGLYQEGRHPKAYHTSKMRKLVSKVLERLKTKD